MSKPVAPEKTESAESEAFVLPPRQPTFLARYSRRSKVSLVGCSLIGLLALSYLFSQMTGSNEVAQATNHHKPKINSTDWFDKADTDAIAPDAPQQNNEATGTGGAEALNKQDDHTVPMAPAPDPDLTESTPQGDLPRIGEDGRQPWQVYARPFNAADKRPRLAIVVTDLGLSRSITDMAISRLPAAVTLAFDTQSPVIGAWCGRARQEGHEIFLSVPMEPFDYPRSDPGPHTLLTTAPNLNNLEKLQWSLRQGSGYVGLMTMTGTRFTSDSDKMKLVMQTLKQRGLMVIDTHIAPHSAVTDLAHDMHIPVATASERIDQDLSPEAIDNALQQLEQAARLNGKAVGVVAPLPLVIDRLQAWLKTLPQQGIALAPISAVVQ